MDLKGMASSVMSSGKIQELLQGLNWPISKQEIIKKVQEKGVDTNILSKFQNMTDKQYNSASEVVNEVTKTQ